jgi:hypothetical protein
VATIFKTPKVFEPVKFVIESRPKYGCLCVFFYTAYQHIYFHIPSNFGDTIMEKLSIETNQSWIANFGIEEARKVVEEKI